MAITSVSWYVIIAIRFTVADGSELGGTGLDLLRLCRCLIAALAVGHLVGVALHRLSSRVMAPGPGGESCC